MAGDLKCSCNILGTMGFASKRVDHYDWKTTDSTIVETCVSEAYEDSCVGFGLRLSIVFNDVVKRYFIPINAKGWNRDLLGGF